MDHDVSNDRLTGCTAFYETLDVPKAAAFAMFLGPLEEMDPHFHILVVNACNSPAIALKLAHWTEAQSVSCQLSGSRSSREARNTY